MSNDAKAKAIFNLVLEFFDGDHYKTSIWWFNPNPAFGQVSPQEMCNHGREAKLLKWVKAQLAENNRD